MSHTTPLASITLWSAGGSTDAEVGQRVWASGGRLIHSGTGPDLEFPTRGGHRRENACP